MSSGNGTTWDNARARMLWQRAWSIPGAALVLGQDHAPEDALSSTNNGCSLDPAAAGDFSLVESLPCLIDAFSPIIKCCLLCSSKCRPRASPSGPARVPSGGRVPYVFDTCSPHILTCCGIRGEGHQYLGSNDPLLQHKAGIMGDTDSCSDGA